MTEKLLLGVAPYYIPAGTRITELAQAIIRYTDAGCGGQTKCIIKWAQEIIEQCRLIEAMQKVEPETLADVLNQKCLR